MKRLLRTRATRGAIVTALAGFVTAVVVAAAPAVASADTTITVRYPVNGSTFLKAANATITLGPGTLRSKVDLNTGAVTASLKLPPATGSFKELGLIPVTATAAFIQDGPTTGKVNVNTGGVATKSPPDSPRWLRNVARAVRAGRTNGSRSPGRRATDRCGFRVPH